MQHLKLYGGKSLLDFNDSITQPCGILDLLVYFGKGKYIRTINIIFFVIPCESVYIAILESLFLAALYVVASPILLKMKYHNDVGQPVLVKAD